MTNQREENGKGLTTGWSMEFKDRMGITLQNCDLEGKALSCNKGIALPCEKDDYANID